MSEKENNENNSKEKKTRVTKEMLDSANDYIGKLEVMINECSPVVWIQEKKYQEAGEWYEKSRKLLFKIEAF